MTKCLFEKATGVFVSGSTWDDIPHDTATHIQIDLPEFPDRANDRWDGDVGVRPATAQELADATTAKLDKDAVAAIDDMKAIKALALWVAEKLSIPPATARSEIIAKYKGL